MTFLIYHIILTNLKAYDNAICIELKFLDFRYHLVSIKVGGISKMIHHFHGKRTVIESVIRFFTSLKMHYFYKSWHARWWFMILLFNFDAYEMQFWVNLNFTTLEISRIESCQFLSSNLIDKEVKEKWYSIKLFSNHCFLLLGFEIEFFFSIPRCRRRKKRPFDDDDKKDVPKPIFALWKRK